MTSRSKPGGNSMTNHDFTVLDLFDDQDFLVQVKAGHKLFSQGDRPDNVYVLKSGTAHVVVDGRLVEVASRGTILGEMALIDHEPRAGSVLAISDCEFFVIGPDHFEGLIQKRPQFATYVMRVLVRRIRAADRIGSEISQVVADSSDKTGSEISQVMNHWPIRP